MSAASNIQEQRNILEHALSERMINHALTILREWDRQLGGGLYADRIRSIEQNYHSLFEYFLSADDPDRETIQDSMTTETYRLMDEIYADLRLKKGLAQEITTFNPDRPESVVDYFSNCVHLREEDYEWWSDLMQDENRSGTALLAITALNRNLREQFCEESLRCMIDALDSSNTLVSSQLMVFTILSLVQWDIRIDFFPELQEAFVEKIGDGDFAFAALCALVKSSQANVIQELDDIELDGDQSELFEQLKKSSGKIPADEQDFLREIAEMLPDTWVFTLLVDEDERRQRRIEEVYLEAGTMMMMWNRIDDAEEWLLNRLRSGKATAQDYMNYGHCCFLRGDRLMAYENYHEARHRCASLRQFYDIFRPDRKALMDKGVPLEHIYLIEDQMVS